jgi:hypothetical protein
MNVFCSVFKGKKISIRITTSETTVNNAITISINSSLKFSIFPMTDIFELDSRKQKSTKIDKQDKLTELYEFTLLKIQGSR